MTTAPRNSSAGRGAQGRDRLSRALREARAAAGLSGVRAGRAAGMSQSKVSKIERGLLLPSVDDVGALCRAYGLGGDEHDELVRLAKALREEASARVIMGRGVSEFQRRLTRLSESAAVIRSFHPLLVLGALQTREYTRQVFQDPRDRVSDEEAEQSVEARQERRRGLFDGQAQHQLIVPEGALRWQAGSSDVMVGQIEAVIEVIGSAPRATVGIIPWTKPVHVFPGHGFTAYDEDAVVVGTETTTATLTGAADIATYLELFTELEKLACFGDEAVRHLERIAEEYRQLDRA